MKQKICKCCGASEEACKNLLCFKKDCTCKKFEPEEGCGKEWKMWNPETEEYMHYGKCRKRILCPKCDKPKNHSQQDSLSLVNNAEHHGKLGDGGSNPSSAGTNSPLSRDSVRENKGELQSEVTRSSAIAPAGTPEGKIASIAYTEFSKNSGTNDFNLSSKIWWRMAVYENKEEEFIRLKDFKEFIKKVFWINKNFRSYMRREKEIAKLAGKELI